MSNATNATGVTNATQDAEVTQADEVSLQTIPIKFTLLGVADVTDATDFKFKGAMLAEFKSLLTILSSKSDGGVKFTNVSERHYSRRHLQEETTKNFQFYYDVTVASSDVDANPREALIESVKTHHLELLESIQKYKTENYYYVEDFEMCTPSEGGRAADEGSFDLCSYDHQIVPIQLGAVGLPSDLNVDEFNEELVDVYKGILADVDGLVLAGIYVDELKEKGNTMDFHYKVDALKLENRNMESPVLSRLESDDAKGQIFNHLESYTNQEICVNEDGRYSLEPCLSTRQKQGKLPVWAIATITASIVVVCGLVICRALVIIRRKKHDEEFNNEVGQFQRGRHSRPGRKRRKSISSSHHHSRRRSSDGNDHKDKRRRSNSHHRGEKKHHHGKKKHRRRRTEGSLDV
jgi:hypothetical protein